jgi:hypothetical protein
MFDNGLFSFRSKDEVLGLMELAIRRSAEEARQRASGRGAA